MYVFSAKQIRLMLIFPKCAISLLQGILFLIATQTFGQTAQTPIERIDPPNWWINMANPRLELLVYGSDIQHYDVSLTSAHTRIERISRPSNPDYLLIELSIQPEQEAGTIALEFKRGKKKFNHLYTLLERRNQGAQGIDASDLMYLIFPDRFANGDTTNDVIHDLHQKNIDRTDGYARHGGDIQGIINHLDYLQDLGIQSLWINPLIENNQRKESYHGYAATDLYHIDKRFGTNELYQQLAEQCHQRGIKLIADMVYNHWGNEHPLYKNLIDSSWFHLFPEHTQTTYRAEVLIDPYASEYDKHRMSNGWFDKHMPDLNQQNPHVAQYLIQNSLWWIEYAGIDAFRIDTYAYPDQPFMKQLNEAIRNQYPNFSLFGETWVQGSPVQSFFTEESILNPSFSSSLPSVTDFQLYYAITKGLMEPFGWEEGLRRIQMTLSHDGLYQNPNQLVTFLDNHDLSRFYSMMHENFDKFKMGIALLYTLRGIPCIYYGTEILMKNYCDPDTKVREDFPGGWPMDTINKFEANGRTPLENEAFQFIRTLGQWRKSNAWLSQSKLTQFVPENNTYVYFRHDSQHALMCIYNANDESITLPTLRFAECIKNKAGGLNILTQQRLSIGDQLILSPMSVTLIQLY